MQKGWSRVDNVVGVEKGPAHRGTGTQQEQGPQSQGHTSAHRHLDQSTDPHSGGIWVTTLRHAPRSVAVCLLSSYFRLVSHAAHSRKSGELITKTTISLFEAQLNWVYAYSSRKRMSERR